MSDPAIVASALEDWWQVWAGPTRIGLLCLSLAVGVVGLVIWFRDRASLLLLAIGPGVGLLGAGTLGWSHRLPMGVVAAACLGVSVVAYWLLRWRAVGFAPATALAVAGAAPVLTLWTLSGANVMEENSLWPLWFLPLGVAISVVLMLVVYAGRRVLSDDRSKTAVATAERRGSGEGRIVLDMLSENKVTAAEAAELLEVVQPAVPADRLPLTTGVVASLLGGLEVVIGWIMPWRYIAVAGGMVYKSQSGFHFNKLGGLVLVLGVVPALLACVPALDQYLRQGMLRLFIALIGAVLTLSLVSLTTQGGLPAVGLMLCLLGFGTQVIGAVKETGLVQPQAKKSEK